MSYTTSNIAALESESVYIMREVVAEFERPVLLFSGGKDSLVLLRLAEKAFRPSPFPFPILHIDTGHNFPGGPRLPRSPRRGARRAPARRIGPGIDRPRQGPRGTRPDASRNRLQTITLLDAIEEHRFDAAFGGARRDEEKARAKERVFSLRDEFGQWEPRRQRPELWNLYNGRIRSGQHMRVFPLSNWTELDVWMYIEREELEVPSIYFAHRREVFLRSGMYFAASPYLTVRPDERVETLEVRYRTVGDMTSTGAVASQARTVADVIKETAAARISERGATRADDTFSETAMEDRKREGYF